MYAGLEIASAQVTIMDGDSIICADKIVCRECITLPNCVWCSQPVSESTIYIANMHVTEYQAYLLDLSPDRSTD